MGNLVRLRATNLDLLRKVEVRPKMIEENPACTQRRPKSCPLEKRNQHHQGHLWEKDLRVRKRQSHQLQGLPNTVTNTTLRQQNLHLHHLRAMTNMTNSRLHHQLRGRLLDII